MCKQSKSACSDLRCPSCKTKDSVYQKNYLLLTLDDWFVALAFIAIITTWGGMIGLTPVAIRFFSIISILPVLLKLRSRPVCGRCEELTEHNQRTIGL